MFCGNDLTSITLVTYRGLGIPSRYTRLGGRHHSNGSSLSAEATASWVRRSPLANYAENRVRTVQVHAGRVSQVRVGQVGALQVRTLQVRASQISALQVRVLQVRVFHDRVFQVRAVLIAAMPIYP